MNTLYKIFIVFLFVSTIVFNSCSSHKRKDENDKNDSALTVPDKSAKPAEQKKITPEHPAEKPAGKKPSHTDENLTGYTGYLVKGIRAIDTVSAINILRKLQAALDRYAIMNNKYPDKLDKNFARQCGLSSTEQQNLVYTGAGISPSAGSKVIAYVCASRKRDKYMILKSGGGGIELVKTEKLEKLLEEQQKK